MDLTHDFSTPEWPESIYARLVAQWEGWKNQNPLPNDSIGADDFHSFWPESSRHIGRPTKQQMAEQPIAEYKLSEFRVVPVATEAALVTYFAGIKTPDNIEHHMAVGEYWVKPNGQWRIRGYSGRL